MNENDMGNGLFVYQGKDEPRFNNTYDEISKELPTMLLGEYGTEAAPELPTGFEKNFRKEWLYGFSNELINTQLLTYFNNKFFTFNGCYHEPYNINNIYGILSKLLIQKGIKPMGSDVKFIDRNLRAVTPAKARYVRANIPNYFLYKNCLINVETEEIFSLNPNYFATGAINANFNPNLVYSHHLFDIFLNQITGGDAVLIQRIWEVLAYVISPEYRLRVIFCFIGVGGAGKSVLLKLIENLLTPSLVTNMSISNLATRGFAESELENKRVCIASDEGKFNFNEESAAKLKRISGGGETITVDVKMKAQTTFMVTAKLLIASNYPIHRSASAVDPYLRNRMMIIPFVNSIPQNEQDPYILNKLLVERDAIVTHAFYVYKSLMAKNFVFSGDEAYYENLGNMATTDTSYETMRIFSANFCTFDGTSFTPTETLFQAYTQLFSMVKFKDITSFSRTFLEVNYGKVEQKRKHTATTNLRGFVGVALRNGGNYNEYSI